MKSLVCVVLALVMNAVCSQALARSYDDVIESGYMDIAVYRNFPPYSWLEGDKARGIDIELGEMIARELGVTPRWYWLTADENLEDDLRNAIWKGHVLDSEKKKADIMLRVPYDREFSYAMDGYGLPRNELVHMFAPYQRESWSLARDLVKTGDVRNLAIFQYEKVGVEIDSLPDTFLSGTLRGRLRENVVHYTDIYAAMAELQQGNIAAVAAMRSQLEWGLASTPPGLDMSEDGLETMSKRRWDIGIAIKQDYRQFAYVIEAMIDGWVADQTLQKLFQHYGVSYRQPSVYDN